MLQQKSKARTQVANVPDELKRVNQWLCWDANKKPILAITGSSKDWPNNLASFDVAKRYADEHELGIGFCFAGQTEFSGIDLDACVNPDTGNIEPWADEVIKDVGSYCERSFSGTGVKIIFRGTISRPVKTIYVDAIKHGKHKPQIQFFVTSGYFALTGDVHPDFRELKSVDGDNQYCRIAARHGIEIDTIANARELPYATTSVDLNPRLARARKYIAKIPGAIGGQGGHNATFNIACNLIHGFDLTPEQALPLIQEWNHTCQPPWTEKELWHKLTQANDREDSLGKPRGHLDPMFSLPPIQGLAESIAKIDAEFKLRKSESKPLLNIENQASARPAEIPNVITPQITDATTLVAKHANLRPVVIDGLLREGETCNVIAPPKTGKSWLTLGLAVSVATGTPFIQTFETQRGAVLVLDNELHAETLAARLRLVVKAYGIEMSQLSGKLFCDNLRGRLVNLYAMRAYFNALKPGQFRVIVLDAWYRFLPASASENDNAMVTQLFNELDLQARRLCCCFVLIHHASKGQQGGKAVTDVGAGAGSQSRAADTHIVIRPHEEEGLFVLDAAVRSFPPVEPISITFRFPLWNPNGTTAVVKVPQSPYSEKKKQEDEKLACELVEQLGRKPLTQYQIRCKLAVGDGRSNKLIKSALDKKQIAVVGEITNKQGNSVDVYGLPETQKTFV